MKNDIFKNLIEAVVALAADEVVKLIDGKRDAHADLAKVLYVDMGAAEHIIKRQPFEIQLKLLDSKRERTADSAQWLWLNSGQHQPFYTEKTPEQIVQARIDRQEEVLKCGLHPVYVHHHDVVMNCKLYESTGDGYSFKLKYPDREKTADAAQYVWKNQAGGRWESVLKNHDSAAIRNGAKQRQEFLCTEVADAAQCLYMVHGIDEVQLNWGDRESIIGKAVALNRPSIGDIKGGMRCIRVHPTYALWKPAYPDRERTADSAQYLWKNQHSGNWADILKRYTSAEIRHTAQARQAYICKDVADAAWIAFDEGGYRLDLKCGSVERILDLASRAKSRRVWGATKKMIGVLKLDGFGKFGQCVKVEGIPVFEDSGASADPECEFVKSSAEAHGLTVVTGILYSFGPGIYQ